VKVNIKIEFKDIPAEKIHRTLSEILNTLKAMGLIEEGEFEIFTPDGILTEKCILQENRVIG
jgi:hypothetical protein